MPNKFYLTTTLPYVNAEPHIGFALEIVQADVLARWRCLNGAEVFFNTGTDEHGLKIYRKALAEGKEPQSYCDEYAAKFDNLKAALNLSYNSFIRTTDEHHAKAAQEFWRRCAASGDIYKKKYQVKYCVGCELEKTESELVENKCPLHPNLALELIDEENYFFRYSKYQKRLLELYKNNLEFVVPASRLNEIIKFTERGLVDFSISRLREKMPWGVAVPGDSEQIMYVWFDALVNYISCLGWPDNETNFKKWWPGRQVAGKDNLRQQASMWQAMLMSAGLLNSKQILIHGFITSGGEKMSKSLGNAVNPFELVEKYGTDAVRYWLLAEISPFEDGDYTEHKFQERYHADLANGLGNLVARISNLIEKNALELPLKPSSDDGLKKELAEKMEHFKFNEALSLLWAKLKEGDETISKTAPWQIQDKAELRNVLAPVAQNICNVAALLQPFLPATAEKIVKQFGEKKIKKGKALFPRIEKT